MGRRAAQEGASPAQAISLLERAGTIQALPVSTARGSIDLTRTGTHSPIKDVTQVRWRIPAAPISQDATP